MRNGETKTGRSIWLQNVVLGRWEILSFVLSAGLLATFRKKYVYGLINQLEHLPPIKKLIDPSLYPVDWHVAQNLTYGPRTFYYHLIAALGSLFPLPAVMLTITIVSNVATLWISFLLGRKLFRNDVAAIFGVLLIAGMHAIDLGMATFLVWEHAVQASIAMPLALGAVLVGLDGRLKTSVVLSLAASLMHPVVGLLTGGLILGAVAAQHIFSVYRKEDSWRDIRNDVFTAVSGFLVLVLFAWVVFLRPLPSTLTSDAFFSILVYFRNPHHYVPSLMKRDDFLRFGLFACGMIVMASEWWKADRPDRSLAYSVGALMLAVLGTLLAGYVFVELVPVRTVASMQLFRNVALIKWFGLLAAGYLLAVLLQRGITSERMLALIIFGFAIDPSSRELLYTLFLALVVVLYLVLKPGVLRAVVPPLLVGVGLVLVLALRNDVPAFKEVGYLTLQDAADDTDPAARWAREHVPADAVFQVPPDAGRFRLVSERALVVDFKAFVFQDSAVAEWMQRMTDSYGGTSKRGFAARSDLKTKYTAISESRLLAVRRKYDARYALLFVETPARFKVLYRDARYKIVDLDTR